MSDPHEPDGDLHGRRPIPAGQALAVVLVALLVGSVLNAERLDHTARTQPYGWQRTVAMAFTGPLVAVSRGVGLTLPRKVLSEAVGNELGPAPEDTRTVVTAPPLTGGTTTTAAPVELRIPTEASPLTVHIAGDSLMIPIGPALLDALDGAPVDLTEGYKAGTGLSRPDVLNWPAKLEADMAEIDPDVLVLGFGGNDAQGIAGPDGPLASASPEWAAEYQRRVAQVLDAVEKEGRTVYWMGLPTTTAPNIEEARPLMRAAVEREIAARPWAHYIDTDAELAPDGYAAYLPDEDGKSVKVRTDDGIHLTLAGADRAVRPLADALVEERKLEVG